MCGAVGRFSVAIVPHLCASQCGRCVVSAWQLSVSRQVCLTIGRVKKLKNCATPRFSNVLRLEGRKVGSLSGGWGAIWLDEKSKRAKHISKSKN